MKILIIAEKHDSHAVAVDWALRSAGYEPTIWSWSEFPKTDAASYSIHPQGKENLSLRIDGTTHDAPFDVVWYRRALRPTAGESSHPDDRRIIVREATAYLRNSTDLLGHEKTFWVNPVPSLDAANNKIVQLRVAAALGFPIPDTLIGNDFDSIRRFYDKHDGNVIYKAFAVGGWYTEGGPMTVLRTSKITEDLMSDEESFTHCPGIYQEQIAKRYEIRVTVMGSRVLAAKIDSQADGETVDWRYDLPAARLAVRSMSLPPEVEEKCLAYCRSLGLVFACIDLIHDTSGRYVFLEANESGQFLWKEELDPTLDCLSTFCQLLTSSDSDADRSAFDGVSLAAFDRSERFRQWLRQKQTPLKDDPGFVLETLA